jgi:TorA maturation chaperone TorD
MASRRGELLRALAVLAEPPTPEHDRLAALLDLPMAPTAAAYTSVFVFDLYPYASVYLGAEGMLGGEARDRVAGFFRAAGTNPPTEPDHLATLLAAYADIVDMTAEPAGRLREALLWEHLLPWLVVYLPAVAAHAVEPFRSWAALLLDVMTAEAKAVGWPGVMPLHLRAAPAPADPRTEGARPYLDSLLAPVRSGMILTSTTLARAAGDLGLGVRIAERRYILRSLFDQDVAGTLRWLAAHADEQAARLPRDPTLAALREFWAGRLAGTAALLHSLADEARASRDPAGAAPR